MKFEIFKAADGWRFRLVAANGKTVAQSEGYHNKKDCYDTVLSIRTNAGNAKVEIVEK